VQVQWAVTALLQTTSRPSGAGRFALYTRHQARSGNPFRLWGIP
jgi:hypothetical protein